MSGLITLYTPPPPSRPRPIAESAREWMRWWGFIGSVIVAAVGYGIVSVAQGDALTGLLGTIPGVVNAIATVLTAFGIVRQAEPQVTPLLSPRARDGRRLRPETPSGPRTPSGLFAPAEVDYDGPGGWWDSPTGTDPAADTGPARGGIAYPVTNPGPDDDRQDDRDDGGRDVLWTAGHPDPIGHRDHPTTTYPAETAAPNPDTYRAPDTYPVADTGGTGHHSSSDSGSGSSGGGGE